MALFDFFARLRHDDGTGETPASPSVHPTSALPRFLNMLRSTEQPVLLDLGSVTGSNVTFFGEELGCKVFVEDLVGDIDRHAREGRLGELPSFCASRLTQAPESIDGVLCWDVFDYLDKASARALAAALARLVKPGGAVLGFFATAAPKPESDPMYARFVVADAKTLHVRRQRAARGKQRPHENRDIQTMFAPLVVSEQFLLKAHVREVLLRKPAAAVARQVTA